MAFGLSQSIRRAGHGGRQAAVGFARWRSSRAQESSIAMLGSSAPWAAALAQQHPPPPSSTHPTHRHSLTKPSHLQHAATPNEPSFYSDHVDRYCAMSQHPVTLHSLLQTCAPPLTRHGLVCSAQYLWHSRPVRYAQRVRLFQQLPYIVNLNPHIHQAYQMYYANFEESRRHPAITDSEEDLRAFADMLARQSRALRDIMPQVARGVYECRRYFGASERKRFLDRLIAMRIGLRLLTDNFVAHHGQYTAMQRGEYARETRDGRLQGIVDTRIPLDQEVSACAQAVQATCEMAYGAAPDYQVDGHRVVFGYVPAHVRYMLTELIKNAFRATMRLPEHLRKPVRITVAQGGGRVAVRVRDAADGIPQNIHARVFEYSFTTETHHSADDGAHDGAESLPAQPPIAGLGFGLPMAKVYAEYFGGALNLISMQNHGCDAFLELPSIETTEKIHI